MIPGELSWRVFPATVLTFIIIPYIDILSAKPNRGIRPFYKPQEPDNGGQLDGKAYRMDLPVVLFDHLYLTQGEHDNRPLPVDDLKRFIGNI